MKHRLKSNPSAMTKIEIGNYVVINAGIVWFSPVPFLGAPAGIVTAIGPDFIEYEDGQARRDGNGSLMCDGCEQPFPYAESVDGKFICYGCRSFH